MGKRGPKPKPTALRLIEGNPGRMPIDHNEPQCAQPPVMPATVGADAHAAAEWQRLRDVCPPQLYTAMDTGALTQYCLAWSMLIRSQAEIDARGLLIEEYLEDKDGNVVGSKLMVNPAAKTWKAASEALLKTVDRLGLSPATRARINMPSKAETASKFAGLIGRGN